jgi:hypothetical protein
LLKESSFVAVLKGHGFIRADSANKTNAALATEGCLSKVFIAHRALFQQAVQWCRKRPQKRSRFGPRRNKTEGAEPSGS